jgi:GNAT superfamily N-acetyltransferase
MTFLIDSNVVIAAEPFKGQLEELQPDVSAFMRIASQHGHTFMVHPATLDDLRETTDPVHRKQNVAAFRKYPVLDEVDVPQRVLDVFPSPMSSNDHRDARILAALDAGAVHFLVTNDRRLRRRAIRLGHEPNVLLPTEAAEQLAAWHPDAPPPPPSVEQVKTYSLDTAQPIFDSLREAYDDFDGWIAKVKKESATRRAWIIRDANGVYEALAIVKMRDDHPVPPGKQAIKLATFKVGENAAGRRLGELLLKTVLRWAKEEPGRPAEMFVEVDTVHDHLHHFLGDFGFTKVTHKVGQPDEQVWLKVLDPPAGSDLSALEHHVAYGPPAVRAGAPIYVIPIIPKWYEDLFPDADSLGPSGTMPLFGTDPEPKAHGNAIRKAYLCKSPTNSVPEGSTLLFYRSQGQVAGDGAVVAVGVAERSHKSTDPRETIELSFKRTVYLVSDVADLHQDGKGVLTILFRHDRFINPAWPVDLLRALSVVSGPPQSVTRVRSPEGIAWVEEQLSAWP